MKRKDERDIMFSRMELVQGTDKYKKYYRKNPDKKEVDDHLRSKPEMMSPQTPIYDKYNSPMVSSAFRFLSDIKQHVDGKSVEEQKELDPEKVTEKIKQYASYYGADLVGITKLRKDYYYSNRGRGDNYGDKIDDFHDYAIVFAVEMEQDMINRAPRIAEAVEVTKGYVNAALIGMMVSYYIRELGYEARNHMDGNYLLIAPLVAEAAGLGQVGRMGLLLTREYGPNVRLGVVSTNLELKPDSNLEEDDGFIFRDFCKVCKKCALTCPGNAIPEKRKEIDGRMRWQIDQEDCYTVWRELGSDCGVCLSTCPFTQDIDLELLKEVEEGEKTVVDLLNWYDEKYPHRPFNTEVPDLTK